MGHIKKILYIFVLIIFLSASKANGAELLKSSQKAFLCLDNYQDVLYYGEEYLDTLHLPSIQQIEPIVIQKIINEMNYKKYEYSILNIWYELYWEYAPIWKANIDVYIEQTNRIMRYCYDCQLLDSGLRIKLAILSPGEYQLTLEDYLEQREKDKDFSTKVSEWEKEMGPYRFWTPLQKRDFHKLCDISNNDFSNFFLPERSDDEILQEIQQVLLSSRKKIAEYYELSEQQCAAFSEEIYYIDTRKETQSYQNENGINQGSLYEDLWSIRYWIEARQEETTTWLEICWVEVFINDSSKSITCQAEIGNPLDRKFINWVEFP